MKKPGKDYDWNDAVGKPFHGVTGQMRDPSPTPDGTITRVSKSRVYYLDYFGKETYCQMDSVSLVEVTPRETERLGAAWQTRNQVVRVARLTYRSTVDEMCDQDD